ncbi:hypothetical protein [Aeromicrobium sp.]|uniref:hypothetical protein n=1 Tax=Aeromicrobium sp. TaxID=1871063 RepID=UPI0019982E18|nr:hypothetical protein [Aeromicrobium sp.]MBC7630816.1 hypothetical protein [Aeromicrobium sp.]
MTLRPLTDVSPADWFASNALLPLGPPGFGAYARVLHSWLEGPGGESDERADGHLSDRQLRVLGEVLARHTTTPTDCFFALWDGYGDIYGGESAAFLTAFSGPSLWPGRIFTKPKPPDPPPPAFPASVIDGPRLSLSSRDYLLFGGSLGDAGAWGATGYGHGIPRDLNSPNLFWPADHAWFVSTDIEGSWTGLAGPVDLIEDLLLDERLEVVRARYDDPKGQR